jgi:hypothetical protein
MPPSIPSKTIEGTRKIRDEIFWTWETDDEEARLRQRREPVGSYGRFAKPFLDMYLTTRLRALNERKRQHRIGH